MLTGIIVGGAMVVVMAIIMGVKDGMNKVHIDLLRDEITMRGTTIEQQEAKINDLHGMLMNLSESSADLVYDYNIIADLLYDAIGQEEADKQYNERKAQQPTDLNELIKQVNNTKEKHANAN